jgi:hypothetical protein
LALIQIALVVEIHPFGWVAFAPSSRAVAKCVARSIAGSVRLGEGVFDGTFPSAIRLAPFICFGVRRPSTGVRGVPSTTGPRIHPAGSLVSRVAVVTGIAATDDEAYARDDRGER